MPIQQIFTIGFTRSTAEYFFKRLEEAAVLRVVDTRLKQNSQLAGFAKQPDLQFFLRRIASIDCVDEPLLAPEAEDFRAYRQGELSWDEYALAYSRRLADRDVLSRLQPQAFAGACLLCSEATPHQCHRRLAADHLAAGWHGSWSIVHL